MPVLSATVEKKRKISKLSRTHRPLLKPGNSHRPSWAAEIKKIKRTFIYNHTSLLKQPLHRKDTTQRQKRIWIKIKGHGKDDNWGRDWALACFYRDARIKRNKSWRQWRSAVLWFLNFINTSVISNDCGDPLRLSRLFERRKCQHLGKLRKETKSLYDSRQEGGVLSFGGYNHNTGASAVIDTCHWGMWGGDYMQIRLRYGDNRPLEVDKRRCCAIFRLSVTWAACKNVKRRADQIKHRPLHRTIQIRLFTSSISDCDTAGTVRLSLRSSVWGNKEGSVWTAAKTFAHSGSLLAVSTSSPGVSHTRLTSCFCQKPRQLLSSLHGNRALVAEVCCLRIANHPLGQLCLFWYAVILDWHQNQTEIGRLKAWAVKVWGEKRERSSFSDFCSNP